MAGNSRIHSIPMPATVGHLIQLTLWLRKDDAVFPGMMEVSIAALNLEEAQTVVETHILARQGYTSQSLQLYDGVPHTIAVTVRPVGGEASAWALPTVGLSVDVMAVGPPLAVQIRMIAIWLGVLTGRDGRWLFCAPNVLPGVLCINEISLRGIGEW